MNRLEEMREECETFHAEHPEVWDLFVRFTFEKIADGFQHYGARPIFARIRWETDKGGVADALKINDHHSPFYSRRFEAMYPEHRGFFRKRVQRSKDKPATGRPAPTRFELV